MRRCGQPFRDVAGDVSASVLYQGMLTALEERGLGKAGAEGVFSKFSYAALAPGTKRFLKEAGVPAWSFGLQGSTEETFCDGSLEHVRPPAESEPKVPKRHRAYKEILFTGSPPEAINDTKTFLQVIRQILGKTNAGDACVRFKEELGGKGRTISGACIADVCVGCTWKMLATVALDPKGIQQLEIKADGAHGSRTVHAGGRLWTDKERALLAAAFPGNKKLTVKEVRAAFEASKAPLRCTQEQLKQWITRQNRQKRGKPQQQTISVHEMKGAVERWAAEQPASFADATLTTLRLVGTPVFSAKQVCFAWSARGLLNHLRGLHERQPLCLTVDGKQRVASSGGVVATIGIMATSAEPRNTTLSREADGKKMQLKLRTSTVQPILQAYMDAESNENWTWVFETGCDLVEAEFGYRLEDRVLQVQADFNDGIEHARRQVFPKSRPAYDYPHMMRAVHSSLSKKTTPALRQRVLRVIRVSRHLPTLELFSAVWDWFFAELRADGQKEVVDYLLKEYFREVPRAILGRMYELRSSPDTPAKLWWADYWAGALGTHPGSATGTQTLEAFHSFWQRQIQDQVRANPTEILHTMQRLYDGVWKTWMQEDGGREGPQGLCMYAFSFLRNQS